MKHLILGVDGSKADIPAELIIIRLSAADFRRRTFSGKNKDLFFNEEFDRFGDCLAGKADPGADLVRGECLTSGVNVQNDLPVSDLNIGGN